MNRKVIVSVVLVLSTIAITNQDIAVRKGCDCSICKGVDNKLNPVVGSKYNDDGGGKSSCNICEKRKEMLRMERERQRKVQSCPYEILGSPSLKGKTSHEIFDEFREMVVPSQNGFFDMMRGVVRTMHFSSVEELKWAKEKEARERAKKRAEELRKKKEESKPKKKDDEIVSLQRPVNPKVTVVLKQTPCGQIIAPSTTIDTEQVPVRLPKEVKPNTRIPEEELLHLQPIDSPVQYQSEINSMALNSKDDLLNTDLIDHLLGLNMYGGTSPQETAANTKPEDALALNEVNDVAKASTESPFMKFMSNDEIKSQWKSSRNSADDFGLELLPASFGEDLQHLNEQNVQSAIELT